MIFDAVCTRSLLIVFRYRKVQELGFSSVYNSGTDSSVKKYLTHIFGLPLLNPRDVMWEIALPFRLFNPSAKKYHNLQTIWYRQAILPPCIWADHSSCVERTTNACESFQQKFNGSFYQSYPNIFLFINELINVQVDTYIKIRSSLKIPKMYSTKTVLKQVFLQKHIDKVSKNEAAKFEFVKIVSYHFREIKPFIILCRVHIISLKKSFIDDSGLLAPNSQISGPQLAGLDSIPSFFLKDCASILSDPLTYLFNLSLKSATFPSKWKLSKIVPVVKKGVRSHVENYRAVVILRGENQKSGLAAVRSALVNIAIAADNLIGSPSGGSNFLY
nr:unnamed protein product [Callosobruchus analis]